MQVMHMRVSWSSAPKMNRAVIYQRFSNSGELLFHEFISTPINKSQKKMDNSPMNEGSKMEGNRKWASSGDRMTEKLFIR